MKTIVYGQMINERGQSATFTFDTTRHQVFTGPGGLPADQVTALVSELHATALDSDLFKAAVEGTQENPSEIAVKTRKLAEFLMHLATFQAWEDAEEETRGNYWLDARETIMANPHLLSFAERERLSSQYPGLAV